MNAKLSTEQRMAIQAALAQSLADLKVKPDSREAWRYECVFIQGVQATLGATANLPLPIAWAMCQQCGRSILTL
jgi:hypothetical protein